MGTTLSPNVQEVDLIFAAGKEAVINLEHQTRNWLPNELVSIRLLKFGTPYEISAGFQPTRTISGKNQLFTFSQAQIEDLGTSLYGIRGEYNGVVFLTGFFRSASGKGVIDGQFSLPAQIQSGEVLLPFIISASGITAEMLEATETILEGLDEAVESIEGVTEKVDDFDAKYPDFVEKYDQIVVIDQGIDLASQQIETARQETVAASGLAQTANTQAAQRAESAATSEANALTYKNAAETARNETIALKASVQDGIPKGPYNPATNTPALTGTTSEPAGAYYVVSGLTDAGAAAPFAGFNFTQGTILKNEDKLESFNGTWFLRKGASGLTDGSVVEKFVAEKAITPSKTSFMSLGANIFPPTIGVTANVNFNASGDIISQAGTFITDFVRVTGGQPLAHNLGATSRPFVEYNAAGVKIKYNSSFTGTAPITLDANTVFIRMRFPTGADLTAFMLVQSATPPTVFAPYRYSIGTEYLNNAHTKADFSQNTIAFKPYVGNPYTFVRFNTGPNIYNSAGDTPNARINTTTGEITTNAAWTERVSSRVNVTGGATYTPSFVGSRYVIELDIYDNIKRVTNAFSRSIPLVTGADTAYIRFQMSSTDTDVSVVQGSAYLNPYQPYVRYLPDELLTKYLPRSEYNPGVTLDQLGGDPSQLVRKVVGDNIFNAAAIVASTDFNSTTGALSASGSNSVSELMPVEGGVYYAHNQGSGSNRPSFEYKADGSPNRYNPTWTTTAPIQTHPDTRFLRIRFVGNTPPTDFKVQKGQKLLTTQPYQKVVPGILSKESQESIPGHKNRLALPRTIQVLKGLQNSIFYVPIARRTIEGMYFVRFSGTIRNYKTQGKIINPSGTFTTTATLYDADFQPIEEKQLQVFVSDPALNPAPCVVHTIGDSWTYPCTYQYQATTLLQGVTFMGTRQGNASIYPNVYCDGVPGWTLEQMMTTAQNQFDGFSPFVQPSGNYQYYGTTAAWIAAVASTSHFLNRTATRLGGFNATTGYRNTPNLNDVLYVKANSRFERWDGSAWVAIAESELGFTYNYGKALTVWGLSTPNQVDIMFGINDIASMNWWECASAIQAFITRMDQFIAGVKAVSTSIKVSVLIPCSSFGPLDNDSNYFTPARNATMFELREALIAYYDTQAKNDAGIYCFDVASAIDPDYAWKFKYELPYPEYTTSANYIETRKVAEDAVHMDQGMKPFGNRYAAKTQYLRLL
jgi:hypothetical protein